MCYMFFYSPLCSKSQNQTRQNLPPPPQKNLVSLKQATWTMFQINCHLAVAFRGEEEGVGGVLQEEDTFRILHADFRRSWGHEDPAR